MSTNLHPKTNEDVLDAVKWAAGEQIPIEIIGQGSKRAIGRPMQTAHTLDMSGLSGITLFEPEELVLSAKAGTPLAKIEALLKKNKQEFQFEPTDVGPLMGNPAGQGTLGGLVNSNICGPRRLKSGSVRDHILGINAVSGRGEVFKSGGRVVKNVTGYDLSKGVTGSWGTLAVLTDITMKVLPRSETEQSLVIYDLSDAEAAGAMAVAMGSSAEVSGAAHLPAGIDGVKSKTILRLEGFAPSVAYRIENLGTMLAGLGKREIVKERQSRSLWQSIRDCLPFADDQSKPVWRISCTPSEGHRIVLDITTTCPARAYYDWQGGLIWVEIDDTRAHSASVRTALARHGGGHATLIRASAETRLGTAVFQPQPAPLKALSFRYRENFDPNGILNPGRMTSLGSKQ